MSKPNPFIAIPQERKLYESKYFFIINDNYPVAPGHKLIISKRETLDFFSLTPEEKAELTTLIEKAKDLVLKEHTPDGFNIGMNCGATAGQTVMHFHCHLIPRYTGDMDDPRGGVRHCVEGKGYY